MPAKTIGSPIHIRLGPELMKLVDTWASLESVSRAEAIRMLLAIATLHELSRIKSERGDEL